MYFIFSVKQAQVSLSIYTVIYCHTNISADQPLSVNVATITRLFWPYYLVNVEIRTQYLNLIDVHFLVCFLHVFEANFHGINLKKKNKMLAESHIFFSYYPS